MSFRPEILTAFQQALDEARQFEGATAPNPPVGAAAIDREGRILSVQAHPQAGTAHAEPRVLEDLREKGLLERLETLVVTLEPCNHHGRTPPCTEALIASGVKRLVIGAIDPNPRVSGAGVARLREAGIQVEELTDENLRAECEALIAPFAYRLRTGRPWVTVKQVLRVDSRGEPLPDPMIPAPGQKTFSRPDSLRLAHELRKRADAILTGSGTVLADRPEFTVRNVPDHPGKQRWLVVFDRRGRVLREAPDWIRKVEANGFRFRQAEELEKELRFLSDQGVMEAMVEAGPALTTFIMQSGFWCRHVVIRSGTEKDEITHVYRNH